MIYPTSPENIKSRPVLLSKIVKENDTTYIYTLNINRKRANWMHDGLVSFHFAKFEAETYFKNFNFNLKTKNNRLDKLNNIYPFSVRYKDSRHIVFERPPFMNTFRYMPMKAYRASRTTREPLQFNVWFPWSLYIFPFSYESSPTEYPFADPYVLFSPTKLNSLDQTLYNAPLPNIFADGRACMGSVQASIRNQFEDLAQHKTPTYADAFNIFTQSYFAGGWNDDVLPTSFNPAVMIYRNHNLTTYDEHKHLVEKNIEYSNRVVNPSKNNDFVNYMKLWSTLSLEEVLDVYSTPTPVPHAQVNDLYSINVVNSSTASSRDIKNFVIGPNKYRNDTSDLMPYYQAEYHYSFYESPLDSYTELYSDYVSQEFYYQMLENLIDYYTSLRKDTINSLSAV